MPNLGLQSIAMPSIAEISLAVIALAVAIAVIALVPALNQVRRTASRAEEVLAGVSGILPEVQTIVHKLDGTTDRLQQLADSVDRLDRFAVTTTRTMEGLRDVALQVARDMLVPSVANAAGLFAVLREGMQWIRPRRQQKEG